MQFLRQRASQAAVYVAALASTNGCFVPIEVGRQMQADVVTLRAELAKLQHTEAQDHAMAVETTQQILAKIEALSHALADAGQNNRLTDADFTAQMEHMIRDVQELRGAVEVNEHRLGETADKLEQSLSARIAAMGKEGRDNREKTAAASVDESPNTQPMAAIQGAPKGKRELLAFGLGLFKDNNAGDGRRVMQQIVQNYPKELGLTDQALWALGESYFASKKYEQALKVYIQIVDRFAASTLVEGAYYRIALCSAEVGALEDAQTFLTEIVSNHKKSPWFRRASAKLVEVNKRIDARRARAKKAKP